MKLNFQTIDENTRNLEWSLEFQEYNVKEKKKKKKEKKNPKTNKVTKIIKKI